jgi:hypothetical protein
MTMLIWFFRDPEFFAGDDIPGAKNDPAVITSELGLLF